MRLDVGTEIDRLLPLAGSVIGNSFDDVEVDPGGLLDGARLTTVVTTSEDPTREPSAPLV
jgi:hypothetical protein